MLAVNTTARAEHEFEVEFERLPAAPVPSTLRRAFELQKAAKNLKRLPRLGFCPTYEASKHESMTPDYLAARRVIDQAALRELVQDYEGALMFRELKGFHENYTRLFAEGTFATPFNLCVSRPGCTFDGAVSLPEETGFFRHKAPLDDVVVQWYQSAALPTDDPSQPCGREIPASEFSVEPELLERIAQCWDANFIHKRGVRVVPHKIHLYSGEHNDRFMLHGGAQEDGRVATCLVGLGSHNAEDFSVYISAEKLHSFYPATWFFVDSTLAVAREVYRKQCAIMSFKLYRTADGPGRSAGPAELAQVVRDALATLTPPCGVLFDTARLLHEVPPADPLAGEPALDAAICAALRARTDVSARVLPVALTVSARWGRGADTPTCATTVYPCTQEHLDVLLEQRAADTLRAAHPWLDGLDGVPFYCVDFKRATALWEDNGHEYDDAYSIEGSVYFAYAVLLLPRPPPSRSGAE